MKKRILLFLMSGFSLVLFGQPQHRTSQQDQQLDSIMRSVLVHKGKQPIHNFLLYAKNQKTAYTFEGAAGIVGRSEELVQTDYQFKIASITKTFVATIVLQLIEEGRLDYEEKVFPYLSDIEFLDYDNFHILEGRKYASEITIAQLLRHQSGIADIFTDKEMRFLLRVLLKKNRSYTLEDIVDLYYKYKLHQQPTNIPGQGYHYSDMNYMLLGFTIQQITGQSLAENIRQRILEPLGMQNTYFEYYETERGTQKQIDTYLNRINITQKVNTSYEWAGGGLISTTRDLGIFIEALFEEKLFQQSATLEHMTDLSASRAFNSQAGMGIFKYSVGDAPYYGHGGYYGSLMLYSPEEEIVLVANIGQAYADISTFQLVNSLLEVIKGE